MARKLKVYGWTDWRPDATSDRNPQTREIVAATSKAEAERLAAPHRGRLPIEETWNEAEIAQAMSEPGVVFWMPLNDSYRVDGVWRRDNPRERQPVAVPVAADQAALPVAAEPRSDAGDWWTRTDEDAFRDVLLAGRDAAIPPGAEAFACASCGLDFAAHTFKGADGKRRSSDGDCEGWIPYHKPEPFVYNPSDCCKVGHGEWHHGSGCPQPGACSCHAPRQLHPELELVPSWTCGRSLADGGYSPGPLCGEPAYYVVVAVDEFGRELYEGSCAEHMAQEIQDATVVYPTHPIQVSLTVIDQTCWKLGREAWRGRRRLAKHQVRS